MFNVMTASITFLPFLVSGNLALNVAVSDGAIFAKTSLATAVVEPFKKYSTFTFVIAVGSLL